jgi:hypothetical protein
MPAPDTYRELLRELNHQQKLRTQYEENRRELETQVSQAGNNVPINVHNELVAAKEEIGFCQD